MNTIEEFLQCKGGNGILYRKIVLVINNLQKFEMLISLEQIIQTVKGQCNKERMHFSCS